MDFNEFLDLFSPIALGSAISPDIVFWRVVGAAIMGFFIGIVTYLTYTGERYTRSVIHSQIIITIVSAIIINVIGDNIARAFGLFGALSFIRFRTTLRDTKDTAIFFYSVSTGMAFGLGLFDLALIGAAIMFPLLFILRYVPFLDMRHSVIKFKHRKNVELKTPPAPPPLPALETSTPVNIGDTHGSNEQGESEDIPKIENGALIKDLGIVEVKNRLRKYLVDEKVKFELSSVSDKSRYITYQVKLPLDKALLLAGKIARNNEDVIESFSVENYE